MSLNDFLIDSRPTKAYDEETLANRSKNKYVRQVNGFSMVTKQNRIESRHVQSTIPHTHHLIFVLISKYNATISFTKNMNL